MSDDALHQLAGAAGIAADWTDYRGAEQQVSAETLRALLTAMELPCASAAQIADSKAQIAAEQQRGELPPLLTAVQGETLLLAAAAGLPLQIELENGDRRQLPMPAADGVVALPADLPPGYHRLRFAAHELTLAVAPRRAWGVADAAGNRRIWGLAAQLYGLRRTGGGGIGDFTALGDLAEQLAARGGDALAISPAHALFAAEPGHFSPYSPSSRLFLNVLHGDPALLAGSEPLQALIDERGLATELLRLEQLPLIDWPTAGSVRLALLRAVYERLAPRLDTPQDPLAIQFEQFIDAGGAALHDHACFETLHAGQVGEGHWAWQQWPAALRDPRSSAVADFAAHHRPELRFHLFAQWLAARGLANAQRRARDAGMAIGLIGDLAVGTSPSGSHAWSRQQEMLNGLSVGAPPDLMNALGQGWGLATFSPRALRRHGFGAFIEMLRACLRHVGGLRIDHVLGLRRLWLVPDGADARQGAYLQYPFADQLRLIALESHRHRALVVGEDLGTVPKGFRDELYSAGVMGMRVLWFERDHGLFIEPQRWPAEAMATSTTHDLPTVAGWWQGRDIDWRARLGLFAADGSEAQDRAERDEDRHRLWGAFRHAGVINLAEPAPDQADAAIDAALRFVAQTPATLAIVPIEDIAGLDEQPNLPGTTDEHPNWRRRLPADSETLFSEPRAAARLASIARERR